jgi:hypothetical protein
MALRRLTIDLAIPEPLTDNQLKAWDAAIVAIKTLKGYTKAISTEETPAASWHICKHDEGEQCGKINNL